MIREFTIQRADRRNRRSRCERLRRRRKDDGTEKIQAASHDAQGRRGACVLVRYDGDGAAGARHAQCEQYLHGGYGPHAGGDLHHGRRPQKRGRQDHGDDQRRRPCGPDLRRGRSGRRGQGHGRASGGGTATQAEWQAGCRRRAGQGWTADGYALVQLWRTVRRPRSAGLRRNRRGFCDVLSGIRADAVAVRAGHACGRYSALCRRHSHSGDAGLLG